MENMNRRNFLKHTFAGLCALPLVGVIPKEKPRLSVERLQEIQAKFDDIVEYPFDPAQTRPGVHTLFVWDEFGDPRIQIQDRRNWRNNYYI